MLAVGILDTITVTSPALCHSDKNCTVACGRYGTGFLVEHNCTPNVHRGMGSHVYDHVEFTFRPLRSADIPHDKPISNRDAITKLRSEACWPCSSLKTSIQLCVHTILQVRHQATCIKAVLSDDEGMGQKAHRNPACIMPRCTGEDH
jgi:hypothetical protein